MMNSAGNWGWPFCQAGNRWGYRAKLATPNGGGIAAPLGHPGTVGGGADGQTGGYFDCRGEILNDSPYNTGLTDAPRAEAGEHLVRPAGRLLRLPEERQRRRHLLRRQHGAVPGDVPRLPVDHRRQPGADRRRHLPQAGR